MATTTLKTLRQEILEELDLGILIANTDFALTSTTVITITDPRVRDTELSVDHFRDLKTIVTRLESATADGADFYRKAGDLVGSTGALTIGPAVTDVTKGTEVIELWYHGLIAGKEIQDAINRAMRDVFRDVPVALSHLSDLDGDMALSTDTFWTDVLTPTTSAKSTTGRRTPYGPRSYNLINNAALEGTQSATIPITMGKRAKGFTIASADIPAASYRFYDVTNSADATAAAMASSEEQPQLLMQDWQVVSATAREIATRHLGTTDTSNIFWNQAWIYKEDELAINLPSYVSEHFMAPYIFQARPTGGQTAANCWNANSLEHYELTEGKDYTLQFHQGDANPYRVLFHDTSYFDWPLFIQARRPYSDDVTFSAETDTTTCPINLIKPRAKQEIIDTVLIPRGINPGVRSYQRIGAQREIERANAARPVPKESQRRRWGGIPSA